MADGNVSIGGVEIEILAGQGRFQRDLVRAEQRARAAGGVMAREFDRADASAQRLEQTLKRGVSALALFGAGFGAAAIVRGVVEAADAMTSLRGRIASVITETESLDRVQRDLFNSAQANRASLEAQTQLYLRLRQSVRELTHEQALNLSSTFSQTLVLSGASAAEAAASMLQFAQAMGSGRLQGDELRSLLENNTRFARALADGLGVTIGQLRELGEAGALTTTVVQDAITSQSTTIESEFAAMPTTVGQAMQQLQNAILQYVGDTDKALGVNERLAAGINLLTQNLNGLLDALVAVSAGVATGALLYGMGKVAESAFRMSQALRLALSDIAAGTNPGYRKFAEPLMKSVLDAERAMLDYQRAVQAVTRAEQNLAAAQAAGNSARSIAAYKGQVTRAQNLAASLEAAAVAAGNSATQMQAQYDKAARSITGRLGQIGAVAGRMGSALLNAFGGPVGLAITAASIAMAVFTHNALEAARAARSIQSGLEIVANLNIEVSDSARDAADETGRLANATNAQARAVQALAAARREQLRAELQLALNDAKKRIQDLEGQAASQDFFAGLLGGGNGGRDGDLANPDIGIGPKPGSMQDQANKTRQEMARLNETVTILSEGLKAIDSGVAKFGDSSGAGAEKVDELTAALQRFEKVVEGQRGSQNGEKLKSELVKNALETLAETDLKTARDQLPNVLDILTDADEAAIKRKFDSIAKSLKYSATTVANRLNEFRTPAEDFLKTMKEIRDADSDQGNKSLATLQAIIDFGREAQNIPAAIAALEQVKDVITDADAARARDELGKVAKAAAASYGSEQTRLLVGYAEALKKINDAEAALIATGQSYDAQAFDEARAQLAAELTDAAADANPSMERLNELIKEMLTPTEKLASALAELDIARRAAGDNTQALQAIARKRVELLEDEARAAGYAADALTKLRALQAAAGLSENDARKAAERIRKAAAEGFTEGNRPSDPNDAAMANREAAARGFAEIFSQSLLQGIRSGNFGEALRDTLANAAASAFTAGIEQIGQWIGDSLFGPGGLLGGAVDFLGSNVIGDSAKAAAEATAATSLTALATSAGAATAAQDLASVGATTALGALATAAGAAATALASVAASGAGSSAGDAISAGLQLIGGGTPGRAHGGKVFAGQPYVVGETGKRELFVPNTDGYVVPSSALDGASAVHRGAGRRNLPAIRMGDINIAGDVGTHDLLRQIEQRQEQQARELPRKVRVTVLEMERRR